jgi:RimJ/RimL family protein N-acetyltransferase
LTEPFLETPRLILRPTRAEDLAGYIALMSDQEHVRFIGGAAPPSTVWRQMMTVAGAWSLIGYSFFTVLDKQTGEFLGRLGPWKPEGWPSEEVGWSLLPSTVGKGYATEGAAAAVDWAFNHLGWPDVIHVIDPDNIPSRKVAERLGSTNQGPTRLPAPLETFAVDAWGQTREQWMENRKRFPWLDEVVVRAS